MSRTVDHIVATHKIAAGRRAAGRPIWDETIDLSSVWSDDELSFEQKRDVISAKIKASRWYQREDEYSDLHEVVEGITEADDIECFDFHFNELYDLADLDRIWIKTF